MSDKPDERIMQDVKGKTERKRKHELTDKGYKIYYAGTYVEATHEELRRAFMLYCIGKLTIEQVSNTMGWTRAEFYAIKTAFNIVKTGQPFTPYEIDNLEPEQMAEIMRIEKKRLAKAKFEAEKYRDIEKEIKRHHKADYWIDRFAEKINSRENTIYEVSSATTVMGKVGVVNVIKITDIHGGLDTENVFNTYNIEVMHKRFSYVATWIVNHIPVGKLIILDTGDMVHGMIHGSVEKHSEYMIDSSFNVTDAYIRLIDTLLAHGYEVEFGKSNGNHSSLESNKKDRVEEENIGRFLPYTLERIYRDDDRVTILPMLTTNNMTVVHMFDYAICTQHGDEGSMSKLADKALQVSTALGVKIIEVQGGHLHHYKAEYINGVLVELTESFCGSDQYAVNKGLVSPYGFRHLTYDSEGKENSKFIRFKE